MSSRYLWGFPVLRVGVVVFAAAMFSSCTTVSTKVLSRNPDEVRAVRSLGDEPAVREARTLLAEGQRKNRPAEDRLQKLLRAAQIAVAQEPGDAAYSSPLYLAAVREVVMLLRSEPDLAALASATSGTGDSPTLRLREGGRELLDLFSPAELFPADQIKIHGLRMRNVVPGAGLPLVAWFPADSPELKAEAGVPQIGIAIPATALLTFETRRGKSVADLQIFRTLRTEVARVDGRRLELAADFSAPVAFLVSRGKNRSIDLAAMFFTESHLKAAGLFQFQPYEPGKIPVVFVHGLMSRPEAWTHALNELLADPEVRRKYQFWFYLYPTGLPVWASAAGLRQELDRFNTVLSKRAGTREDLARLNQKVLVGHSMGGLIANLQIRRGGDVLWHKFSDARLSEVPLSPEVKRSVESLIYFSEREDIGKVIFVATPHRGSPLALRPLAEFFASRIRLPFAAMQKERYRLLAFLREEIRDAFRAPANSVRFLRANSPLLLSILSLPKDPSVPVHSIIGDRGRNDTPNSSDGVVPYWSSHLPYAVTETIVPSGHGANEHEEGIRAIRNILAPESRAPNPSKN